ncbi:MAG: TIGR03560 family F420-dependent LLM class oxidoreductase [Chloroflexi bacterium]|nr:TIGR03560 family F420-dependent LLM class oxidoreductase [Chloroflexota bacterium]
MAQMGIMIEGQNGLNWERWQKLLRAAEALGFQCVFRSDHYSNAQPPDYDSLELWVSLTYAAAHTQRIEFGALVTPVTFRQPVLTARMAAQVDALSGGRLVLGMGAGWQEREHKQFGIPFYDFTTRFAMLHEALELTTLLYDNTQPISFQGQYFSLTDAVLLPRAPRRPPLLIGGNGPQKTLPLVAKYADEWNAVFSPPERFRENNARLNELLQQAGRKPGDVKRSLMHGVIYGGEAEVADKAAALYHSDLARARERGMLIGRGQQLVDQLGAYVDAGVERFMLQWLMLDDLDGLAALAQDVLKAFQ